MTLTFREEWRTLAPEAISPESTARSYDNPTEARADAARFPHRVVQQRLVSDWKDDQ